MTTENLTEGLRIRAAQVFAFTLGYPGVNFVFFPELRGYFPEEKTERYNSEMYLEL